MSITVKTPIYGTYVITRELHDNLLLITGEGEPITGENYLNLLRATANDSDVMRMISAQFADADAITKVTGKQLIASMKITGKELFGGDTYAWIAVPMEALSLQAIDVMSREVYDRMSAGVLSAGTPEDTTDPLIALLAAYSVAMTFPSYIQLKFGVDVAPSVKLEPNVTPDVALEDPVEGLVSAIASMPVKLVDAAADILTGGDVATSVNKAISAVVAPVSAAANVVVPAFNPYADDFSGARGGRSALPTADYTEVASAPASAVSQAANALTATVTGAPTAAVAGRTDYDRAKAKFYRAYKHQPNGRSADRNRKAKNIVTDVAKYVPKRNDFKGLDDTTGVGAFARR